MFKGYDLDGKAIRHKKQYIAKFLTQIESDLVVDESVPTFAQFVEIWTSDYASKEPTLSTYYRYKRILEIRITPYFGH